MDNKKMEYALVYGKPYGIYSIVPQKFRALESKFKEVLDERLASRRTECFEFTCNTDLLSYIARTILMISEGQLKREKKEGETIYRLITDNEQEKNAFNSIFDIPIYLHQYMATIKSIQALSQTLASLYTFCFFENLINESIRRNFRAHIKNLRDTPRLINGLINYGESLNKRRKSRLIFELAYTIRTGIYGIDDLYDIKDQSIPPILLLLITNEERVLSKFPVDETKIKEKDDYFIIETTFESLKSLRAIK
jgi:hypothetical protein